MELNITLNETPGCVLAKYTMAGILWAMHNYCLVAMYTDRRNILTCGFLKAKQFRTPQIIEAFDVENPVQQRMGSLFHKQGDMQDADPSSSSRSLDTSSRSLSSKILNDYPEDAV